MVAAFPDDVVQGLTSYLCQQPDLLAAVGSENGIPFIFQGLEDVGPGQPYVEIESTGSAALVVSKQGDWSSPNLMNSLKFPRVRIDVWADTPRDAMNHPTRPTEARTRINYIDNILDTYLHRLNTEPVYWRNVLSVSCVRLTSMSIRKVKEGNKLFLGTALFAASVLFPPA